MSLQTYRIILVCKIDHFFIKQFKPLNNSSYLHYKKVLVFLSSPVRISCIVYYRTRADTQDRATDKSRYTSDMVSWALVVVVHIEMLSSSVMLRKESIVCRRQFNSHYTPIATRGSLLYQVHDCTCRW